MPATMIYRRLADGEVVKDMHTTSEGNFEYRIVELETPDAAIPEGWSRGLEDAPTPKKAKRARQADAQAAETEGEGA